MNIRITEISRKDIPEVETFLRALYLELGEEKESVEFLNAALIEQIMENGQTIFLKAADEEGLMKGILSLTESQAVYAGGRYGTIDEMYVLPEYRSSKVGHQLIEEVKTLALKKNWKRIDVTAPTAQHDRTIGFYEHHGFIFTGPKLKWKAEAKD